MLRGSIIDFATSPRGWDGDDTYQFTASITQIASNEPPTDLILTSSGILENSSAGAVIGTLSAVDPDAGTSFTYALIPGNGINDADNGLVAIVDSQVMVKTGALVDFEANP
ncbi:MAG: cadherin repeat domain-containing protein, partial [bacterium]